MRWKHWKKIGIACVLLSFATANAAELAVRGTKFTIDGKPAFLLGASYYAGLGAPGEFVQSDLDDLKRDGFNWIRVWATWAGFGTNISAVTETGAARAPFMERLEKLVAACDEREMIVDVTLSRGNGATGGPRLQELSEHRKAIETLLERLRPYRNWYLDLGNERNIGDARVVPYTDLKALRDRAKELDPKRLITASHSSDGERLIDELDHYLEEVQVDFIAMHLPRFDGVAKETKAETERLVAAIKKHAKVVPLHYQEPFRRGYTDWQPSAEDFFKDLRGAIEGGAAGWCFHNGSQTKTEDERPRRSFDLRESRLYDQLDPVEKTVVRGLKDVARKADGD